MKNVYIATSPKSLDEPLIYNIKRELQEFGYNTINLEPFEFNKPVVSASYYINKCDIFIAIVKFAEPILFFQIGYATALSKKIILVSNYEDEIPYFLKHYSFIKTDAFYNNLGIQLHQIFGNITFENEVEFMYPTDLRTFIKSYHNNPQLIDRLTERDFEQIIFSFFQLETNYQPELPASSKDFGYDLILRNYTGHKKTLVEIKKYNTNSKVSINVIQQLVGAMSLYEADHGILLTTSAFTLSARDFANSLPYKIELWDLNFIEKNFT